MRKSNPKLLFVLFLSISLVILAGQVGFDVRSTTSKSFIISVFFAISCALIIIIIFKLYLRKFEKHYLDQIESLDVKFLALSKSNERYDMISKVTSDAVWEWDIKTNNFNWNRGIEGIFGYESSEVGSTLQWWFDQIHPEDSIKISVKLYSFIAKKSDKWQDEYRFKCSDGNYKYVSNRGFLVKDENENVIRMIGAIQDVTKQKIEEQRLKLLETVITESKDAVIITETNESDIAIPTILYVNPAFTTMTGFSSEEVLGKSPTIFMSKNSVKRDIRKLAEALKKKEEFTFETVNFRKNNEPYWVYFSMIPITNTENKHSHWISIQRDISVEKEREKEREQLISELTQNNKDLKQFSYITSHNLRAPLSNLSGLINLMQDITIEDEELKEILDGFAKSTEQLNDTINDLVKVLIIKDSPSIHKEEVALSDIMQNVFKQLSVLIHTINPTITLNFNLVPKLITNKSYLESILLNLMTNSLKYRDIERPLEINITSHEIDGFTKITFEDNGIGIDLERNKDKIFGLYQKFHNYSDSKGLGLYLVKSQVESIGGAISVQSEINKGTTFNIVFKTD